MTSGTQNTLTDSSADWEVDEFKDNAVRIQRNGGSDVDFGIVKSNTSDTLTFDSDLIFAPCEVCTYRIITTFVLTPCEVDSICAFDISENDCALILPKSTEEIDGKFIHTYIVKDEQNYTLAVLARDDEKIFGAKYYNLDYLQESARVYAHQYSIPHWDLLNVENVKRFATGYFANNESVATTTYANLGSTANIVYDNKRRFVEYNRDGKKYLRYTSLYKRNFRFNITAIVSKTGAGGELTLALKKRDGETGTETILTERESSTLFGGGDGQAILSLRVPIELERNDELIVVAKRDIGIFSILAGTTIDIIEY